MTTPASSATIDTPCLVINEPRLRHNITTMALTAHELGVRLRPHIKTHKIPSIAALQLQAGACGVTVAKVSEAAVMVHYGISDVFIAYPLVTPAKIHRALDLTSRAAVCLGLDSMTGAQAISACAEQRRTTVDVRIEIDTGYRRTGVAPSRANDLADYVGALPGIRLTGIFTFRENTFGDGNPTACAAEAGREEGEVMCDLAASMRDSGHPVADVSVGSTPTARHAATVDGVTEIRPGTYVFYDRMQHALGACRRDDIAAAVRATVVSRPDSNLAIVDAGSKALSADAHPGEHPLDLAGYAEVAGQPDLILERLSEEHGMLRVPNGHELHIGDQVELIPNHICTTVALHNYAAVVNDAGSTIRYETVTARGRFT